MAKGRKRTPDNLKLIKGTTRKDRTNANAPDPAKELPAAPAFLTDEALEWFDLISERLQRLGLASATFTEVMTILASRLAEMEALEKDIAENGRSYTSDTQNGFIHRQRPEVAMLNEARRHAQSLLAELGLTPASIGKVSLGDGKQKSKDPWEGFGNGA